jgi:hypothetical protein
VATRNEAVEHLINCCQVYVDRFAERDHFHVDGHAVHFKGVSLARHRSG